MQLFGTVLGRGATNPGGGFAEQRRGGTSKRFRERSSRALNARNQPNHDHHEGNLHFSNARIKTCPEQLSNRLLCRNEAIVCWRVGPWRRLVARSLGVGEVGGSNPLGPIHNFLADSHVVGCPFQRTPTRLGAHFSATPRA